MQQLWTFPKSTENSLILIKDKTIYSDQKKGEDLTLQIKNIETGTNENLPNGIDFETIQQVIFHKDRMEIYQKDSLKTLFIDDATKGNEIFFALKKEMPILNYSATRQSIIKDLGLQLLFSIFAFISLMKYVFGIIDTGKNAELPELQAVFGSFYGNFIYVISSLGFISMIIIAIIYILIAMFFLNNKAEKRPYFYTLKRAET
jgi:hypothetical protein